MNKKILIPAIIAAVILPMTAFVVFTVLSSDVNTDDGKILSILYGTSGNFTISEKAEMTELILLGDVQSVKMVEEKGHSTARYSMVMSYIEIKPTEILKGTPILNDNGNVLLRTPGGETENYITETEDLVLSENEYVFLYLGMNKEETSTYIPVSTDTMYVIRDGQAMNYLRELVNSDELIQKHKDIIKGLK